MKSTGLTAVFSLVLKVFAVASVIVGFGFIIFGCILQSPPKNFTPVALVLVGVLTVLGSSLGWLGARFKPRLLAAYLAVGSLSTLLQLIILLTIFFAQAKIAATIQAADHLRDSDRKYILSRLETGKWLFLWVVLAELVGMVFACVMMAMGKLEGRYANMDQSEIDAEHNSELSNMSKSVNSIHSNRGSNRLAAKLQAKYGGSSAEDFMAGRRWYNIFSR